MLQCETLNVFESWPMWLQYATLCTKWGVMACCEENEDPLSFLIKSRRWSLYVHGIEFDLSTRTQESHCAVSPPVGTGSWAAYWQGPYQYMSLPCVLKPRLLFPAANLFCWGILKHGLWKQLHLMPPSALFLCEWLLWSSTSSVCSFAICMPCTEVRAARSNSPWRSLFSAILQLTSNSNNLIFSSCPFNTLIIAFSAFPHLMEKVDTLPMMA